jgi:hypothetical protein
MFLNPASGWSLTSGIHFARKHLFNRNLTEQYLNSVSLSKAHCSNKSNRITASASMFEHVGLGSMEESAQRYMQEWKAMKLLAGKPQERGIRVGIVVIHIPEGIFTVRKFCSLLPCSVS